MATLSLFDREASKVREFVTACKLYLRIRNERNNSRKTSTVGIDICIRRSSKYLKEKCIRRFGNRY